ncbi:MAG TPA: hypothetical protein VJ828_17130 [Lacipirellulaceae bacterium]|nr:hypothetical protein [Lacipirellulaceae bacterium]
MAWLTVHAYLAVSVGLVTAEQIDLSPQHEPGRLAQVSIELEAAGSTLVRTDAMGSAQKASDRRLPMNATARLRYAERSVPDGSRAGGGKVLSARYYELAEATIKVDETTITPRLADDRRLVIVESASPRPALYSPNGPLKREQLDLLDVVGNSAVLDQLLPTKPVADGESWPADEHAMAAMLTLDSVAVCEVQSVLEEFNASFAKIRVAGVIHGTADGAATEQEIRGVYLFDRRLRRITRFNLAVQEKRAIGGATPGLDAVAKLQITVTPLERCPQLEGATVTALLRSGRGAAALDLLYDSPTLGYQIPHDRQWFVTSEGREEMTLRRVDGTDVVAHCTVLALPPKSAGRQTTLEQFQKDVMYSLGKNSGELVRTRQWQNSHEHYCYEVVVRGNVEDMPVEWHYYLVARESGHRVSLAVTIEQPMLDRVGAADRALVERLKLYPPMPAAQTAVRTTANTTQ